MNNTANAQSIVTAGLVRGIQSEESAGAAHGRYYIECFDKDGNLKWTDYIENTVMTVGKNDILDKYWGGSSYTASFFMGMISSVGYSAISAADTMGSHAGWNEAQGSTNKPDYTSGTRPAMSWASTGASAGAKSSSSTTNFTMVATADGNGTAKGCFVTTNSTKNGTTGTLISAGLFSGGDKVVQSNDQLNISYTFTIT